MARPRTQVPEETRRLVWELRSQRYTLKQISRQTGLRYNFVQRLLTQPHPEISRPPAPRIETLVPNLPTSEVITAQTPRAPQPQTYPLIRKERNYSNRRLPSSFRSSPSREPESETTRRLRTQLEETKLSRQLWEERSAEKRALQEFINTIIPIKKVPLFSLDREPFSTNTRTLLSEKSRRSK